MTDDVSSSIGISLPSHVNEKVIIKMHVIEKSSKIFFFDNFTWFDSAHRALQNCIYFKIFRPFFYDKNIKKTLIFYIEEKHLIFSMSTAFLVIFLVRNV
jgi:hypothetical protein